MRPAAVLALVSFAAIAAASVASCSLNNGINGGGVAGSLNVPNCWEGPYNLEPNFYAATPYLSTLELRIQNGGDYETFSDGVEILIDDTTKIIPSQYGQPLSISLPVGVSPVGVPLSANENPSNVHLAFYLQATCQIQDVALYALDAVTLNAAGNCDINNGGTPAIVCPGSSSGLASSDAGGAAADGGGDGGGAAADAGNDAGAGVTDGGAASSDAGSEGGAQSIGHSTITFTSLFDGNEGAVSAPERLNRGTFTAYLADPRETCPGGVGPPPPCRGFLQGSFSFYFQRGRPAQPFP